MINSQELFTMSAELLKGIIYDHADRSLAENASNWKYAEVTKERAEQAQELIDTRSGEVRGVISTWQNSAQLILEVVFGGPLEGHAIGELEKYSPTKFDGICGRVRIVSTDEMWGPVLSLDLIADETLKIQRVS